MTDAPPHLGELFVRTVRQRDKALFQHLVGETGYWWGVYLNSGEMTEEEQKWAIANRPIIQRPRHLDMS